MATVVNTHALTAPIKMVGGLGEAGQTLPTRQAVLLWAESAHAHGSSRHVAGGRRADSFPAAARWQHVPVVDALKLLRNQCITSRPQHPAPNCCLGRSLPKAISLSFLPAPLCICLTIGSCGRGEAWCITLWLEAHARHRRATT